MERGYIKLYRKTFDHWMWDDSPKSKFEAWILLLKMANHEAKKVSLGNELINVLPGDVITSEVKLSGCLKWSRSKLRSFLQTLENDKMIVRKKDSKKTVITICNYDKYHGGPKVKKTAEKLEKNSERTAKEHNEELKALREQIRILKEQSPPPAEEPKKTTKRFIPPTLEEVTAYCQEKNNGVDGYTFWNFYEAKDWMLGKNKMKKWKAAIATWKKNVKPVEKWKDPFKSECDAVGPPGELFHDVVAQIAAETKAKKEREAKENGLY